MRGCETCLAAASEGRAPILPSAPSGTDDEAGGFPPTEEERARAAEKPAGKPQAPSKTWLPPIGAAGRSTPARLPKDSSHRVSIRPVGAVQTTRRARSDDTDVVSNEDLKS